MIKKECFRYSVLLGILYIYITFIFPTFLIFADLILILNLINSISGYTSSFLSLISCNNIYVIDSVFLFDMMLIYLIKNVIITGPFLLPNKILGLVILFLLLKLILFKRPFNCIKLNTGSCETYVAYL